VKKVFVIGLDCATPRIVFDRREEFPNINKLIEKGVSAPFRSIHPPITIPAWMAMVTGKDAGKQGIYGFRHRKKRTYNDMWLSMADKFRERAIWDIISEKGLKSCLVSMPPSYPPMPLNGNRISCFMTPDARRDYTYPASLKKEIEEKFGPYRFDVKFRTEERDKLKEDLFEMTEQHLDVVKFLLKEKPWQFFMYVEIGVDRLQHAFWKYFDREHHLYEPGSRYEGVMLDYYRLIDKGIGDILGMLDDDTVVFVVSDHGAKAMKGAFCVNQWLIDKGYLVLKNEPEKGTSIEKADVDWSRTKVWAWGGYYSRVFFNVKGREEQGTILPFRYEAWRSRLKKEIESITGPDGEAWNTRAYRPEELFEELNGDYPDLMVYFDDLSWRAAGTLGHESMYLKENDTGPDDAMHDWDGIFIMYDPAGQEGRRLDSVSILDFAPTVLDIMGFEIPSDMKGSSVLTKR
jgi:predicted AlkP superfamily phosphohydrolase/phosphomutase